MRKEELFEVLGKIDGKYVKEAIFNGSKLGKYSFKATDMMLGGILDLYT